MKIKYLFNFLICIALTACSDPYANKINVKLTPSQAEKISQDLPEKDRDLFLRWVKRDVAGEKFGGEGIVKTVKDAINTQVEFEVRQAQEYERQALQRAEFEKEARKKQAKIDAQKQQIDSYREHRRRVHEHISNTISSRGIDYKLQTQFNHYNRPTGQQWAFNIELNNKSDKEIIGLSGYLTLKDVFGKNLGTYPFRFEVRLEGGRSTIQTLWMQDDPHDKNHRNLRQVNTIFPEWFLESLAFKDGTRIDGSSVPKVENLQADKTS